MAAFACSPHRSHGPEKSPQKSCPGAPPFSHQPHRTLSRPPDVPIMFLLCRLRRRRRVVRPRGESSSLTHRVGQLLHVRGLGRVVAIDFHHVRRELVREIVELSTHVFHTITRVSLGATHTQEPLRPRVPAPKPLSNRITRSSTLIAPLSAPPQQCL